VLGSRAARILLFGSLLCMLNTHLLGKFVPTVRAR